MEIGDLLDLITHWCTRGLDQAELERWELDLLLPPEDAWEDLPDDNPWSAASEMAAFEAGMGAMAALAAAQAQALSE